MHSTPDLRRHLPSVDSLAAQLPEAPAKLRNNCARLTLERWRRDMPELAPEAVSEALIAETKDLQKQFTEPLLQTVINASGTVLHTGLGRAPLSERAATAVKRILTGYCDLEFDLPSGKRGNRQDHVRHLLCLLTGAESALVVNNCAGATVLLLQALAQHREVVVSRGELVEIGGSFRVPEIMACAGCHLHEVGATNKTHRRDYAAAIGEQTALLLKVHRSNFEQRGFVADVPTHALAELAKEKGLYLAVDQGSGCVTDLSAHGYNCGLVSQELETGADIVACSGDKLLGGPQAGILLGKQSVIDRCAKHPLARALRCDKLTLAALAATVQDHLLDNPLLAVPSLQMLTSDTACVHKRAQAVVDALAPQAPTTEVLACRGAVGSGALPTDGPDSWAVVPHVTDSERAHRQLRTGSPAVVGRINDGRLLLDCATVFDEQIPHLAKRISELAPR